LQDLSIGYRQSIVKNGSNRFFQYLRRFLPTVLRVTRLRCELIDFTALRCANLKKLCDCIGHPSIITLRLSIRYCFRHGSISVLIATTDFVLVVLHRLGKLVILNLSGFRNRFEYSFYVAVAIAVMHSVTNQ
jgi:hypothetical protein